MSTPWKTDQWFTSNWNWLPEVRQDMHFPAKIRIHDVSLRDGEQQTGIAYNRADKVAIAKKLMRRVCIALKPVCPPSAAKTKPPSRTSRVGFESRDLLLRPLHAFGREAGQGVWRQGHHHRIPSSEHMVKNAYAKDMDWAIKSSIDTTLAAKEAGLYTCFSPSTRP
jgi:hypothetical protein